MDSSHYTYYVDLIVITFLKKDINRIYTIKTKSMGIFLQKAGIFKFFADCTLTNPIQFSAKPSVKKRLDRKILIV
jgi:hypothetical protein